MPSKSEPQICAAKNEVMNNSAEAPGIKIKEENAELHIKEENVDSQEGDFKPDDEEEEEEEDNSEMGRCEDGSMYPMNLPLEVITTIEPFNYAYPFLKNMSNGVLTHRNIFTEQEREVLRKIVEKYRNIVDTRSRTREIYMEKQSVWQQIVEEYNCTGNILMRTEKELKKCWDNMKYRARQAEKEQQKAEILNQNGSPGQHQLACNAVQVALEKMLSMQGQSANLETNGRNDDSENGVGETKDHFNLSPQNFEADCEEEDFREKNDQDSYHDDEQPLLKKARQESPKLSSILLGDGKKSLTVSDLSTTTVNHYNIPNCTKVTHIKKKSKKSSNHNSVSILPKGLNSCVSIMNIPNPNQVQNSINNNSNSSLDLSSNGSEMHCSSGTINLGGGVTISPQKLHSNSLPTSLGDNSCSSPQLKPMPYLKKMLPTKPGLKKVYKNSSVRNSHSSFSSVPSVPHSFSLTDFESFERGNEEKLLFQRLENGEREHSLKMRVLEKQLQAYTNESAYWSLRLKLLKSGQEGLFGKMVNGDI